MTSAPRNVYGPRPVGALLPALVRPAYRGHGPATAQVTADWAAIVGPALAAVTQPRRLVAGTLTIACSGPIALELQHLAPELMARINAQLGAAPVQRLRFTQAVIPAGPPAAAPPPPPSKAVLHAANAAVQALPAGPLRDALESLGVAVLDRSRAALPREQRSTLPREQRSTLPREQRSTRRESGR